MSDVLELARTARARRLGVLLTVVMLLLGVAIAVTVVTWQSSSTEIVPYAVSVHDEAALRAEISSYVHLTGIGHGSFRVTSRRSSLDASWEYFTVTWKDPSVRRFYGFGHWHYGAWVLDDTGYSRVGCGDTTGTVPLAPVIPLEIVHGFGLSC